MWIGTLAAAAAQVSAAPAALLNALNGFCLAYLAAVARWSGGLPGAVLSVRLGSPATLAAAYLLPGTVIAALAMTRRCAAAPLRARVRQAWAVGAALLCATVAAWAALGPHAPAAPARFTLSFLDVGQGDATLLQAPGGIAVLVDGGPAEADVLSKLRAAGVHSLDLVVLTHPQEDHEGGLEAVFRGLPVRLLLDGGGQERLHDRVLTLARSRGTRVVAARAGTMLQIGRLRIRILSPPQPDGSEAAPSSGDSGEDPNLRSVVAIASYGSFDAFLPGDAESDVTATLPLSDVEVLKVAHHGSADPGLGTLLERLRPEVAVIEVGAGNRYGHPHRDTLAALESSVPNVYRTDRDGNVTISLDGSKLAIER